MTTAKGIAGRLRRLGSADGAAAELVLFGNAHAAIGYALIALVRWELSWAASLAVAALAFVFLGAFLLSRATFWIAVLLGGGAAALGPTLLLAELGMRLDRWVGLAGGILGLGLGLAFASRSYLRLARELRRAHF